MNEVGSIKSAVHAVHESEAQRQFSRVRIPATVVIDDCVYKVVDVSAGGVSIENPQNHIQPNKLYKGKLIITVDHFDLSYDIEFSTLIQENENIGCIFQNVEKSFTNALRYIITAFLGGELVSTSDILNTISRDNHTSARKKKQLQKISVKERLASVAGSLVFLAVGLFAITYVMISILSIYSVSTSSTAFIGSYENEVVMPSDGLIEFLIHEDDTSVSLGQIIATYRSNNVAIDTFSLPQETKDILTNLDVKMLNGNGSIVSPCDCFVVNKMAVSSQFIQKGKPVITLLPKQSETFVIANFSFKESENIKVGEQAIFKIYGSGNYLRGTVSSLAVSTDGLNVEAKVRPDIPITLDHYSRPVKVVLKPAYLPELFNTWL